VGSRWAAKQEVPGKDVALGTHLQREGPFPGEETRLWRRAWYMRLVTNFLDQGSFTLATGGGEKSPGRTYKIRTISLLMGQLTLKPNLKKYKVTDTVSLSSECGIGLIHSFDKYLLNSYVVES